MCHIHLKVIPNFYLTNKKKNSKLLFIYFYFKEEGTIGLAVPQLKKENYCVVPEYNLVLPANKARQHIRSCLPQWDCQRNIKIVALLTSVRQSP